VTRARGRGPRRGAWSCPISRVNTGAARDRLTGALQIRSGRGPRERGPAGARCHERALEKDLGEEQDAPAATTDRRAGQKSDCDYDAAALARGRDGLRALGDRMYAMLRKGGAPPAVRRGRRSIGSRSSASCRSRANPAAAPAPLSSRWNRSGGRFNRGDDPGSPYRRLVRLGAARTRRGGVVGAGRRAGSRDRAACRGGMAHVRSRDLARHFTRSGDRAVDFAYESGKASRALAPAHHARDPPVGQRPFLQGPRRGPGRARDPIRFGGS